MGPATVNRDRVLLRRLLRIAERSDSLQEARSFEVELVEERGIRRTPHIGITSAQNVSDAHRLVGDQRNAGNHVF